MKFPTVLVWLLSILMALTIPFRVEQRINVKFCFKIGMTAAQAWRMLRRAHGDDFMSYTQVKMWFKRFQSGDESTVDKPRSGRPSTRQQKLQQVMVAVEEDRRKTLNQISLEVGLSKSSCHRVLHKDLNLSKVALKFVPHILTENQACHRKHISELNLESVRSEPRFLETIISGDETWISVYENETKFESCEWVERGNHRLRPIKALRCTSSRKCMMILFFDMYGVLLLEFVPRNETVDADYYIGVLKRLKDRIRHKRAGMWTGGRDGKTDRDFKLHQDNASPHVCAKTLGFIGENNINLLPHPQYSPDLAPCDYFVFPFIKKEMRGRRFPNLKAAQDEVRSIVKNKMTPEMFTLSLKLLAYRWKKCVAMEGQYFKGRHVVVEPPSEAENSSSESSDSDSDTD